jgi:hypothetical protein
MDQPYLFRYRTRQGTPPAGLHSDCHYDHAKDLIVHAPTGLPAVLDNQMRPLTTKKADVEKGEDRKDSWL